MAFRNAAMIWSFSASRCCVVSCSCLLASSASLSNWASRARTVCSCECATDLHWFTMAMLRRILLPELNSAKSSAPPPKNSIILLPKSVWESNGTCTWPICAHWAG